MNAVTSCVGAMAYDDDIRLDIGAKDDYWLYQIDRLQLGAR